LSLEELKEPKMNLTIPSEYGYVILSTAVLPFITFTFLGSKVMIARKEMDVPYPNLYATPEYHKQADAFNRVQRGHQSMIETLVSFTAFGLIGGIKHPYLCIVSGVFYCAGNFLFLKGYADLGLDVKMARYQRGGVLKPMGLLLAMGSCVSMAISIIRK